MSESIPPYLFESWFPPRYVFRVEIRGLQPGMEAEVLGTATQRGEGLDVELRDAVQDVLPDSSVRISYARGSILIWILVSVGGATVAYITSALLDTIRSRLTSVVRRWLGGFFGPSDPGSFVQVDYYTVGTPAPVVAESARAWLPLEPTQLALVLIAFAAQAALVFAVVWLLVTK